MGYSSWEFSNWKKSSTFTLTKFNLSYNLISFGGKGILCRTKRREKIRGITYLLISRKRAKIPKIFAEI
jgi:hypothetical protein